MELINVPDHGASVARVEKGFVFCLNNLQAFFDEITQKMNGNLLGKAVIFPEYTVAAVPNASEWDNGVVIVSDEAGGRTLATSDGTNWRRVSDGAIIS